MGTIHELNRKAARNVKGRKRTAIGGPVARFGPCSLTFEGHGKGPMRYVFEPEVIRQFGGHAILEAMFGVKLLQDSKEQGCAVGIPRHPRELQSQESLAPIRKKKPSAKSRTGARMRLDLRL
jgi:hypothetical protein